MPKSTLRLENIREELMQLEDVDIQMDMSLSESEDILKCLRHLYTTPTGTYPMNRDFGIDANVVDMPLPAAKTMLAAEYINKTEIYEPRVEVDEVLFSESANPEKIYPVVKVNPVEIDDEEMLDGDFEEDGEDDE